MPGKKSWCRAGCLGQFKEKIPGPMAGVEDRDPGSVNGAGGGVAALGLASIFVSPSGEALLAAAADGCARIRRT